MTREEFVEFGQAIRRTFPSATVTLRTDALMVDIPGDRENGTTDFHCRAELTWLQKDPSRIVYFREYCEHEIEAHIGASISASERAKAKDWDRLVRAVGEAVSGTKGEPC